ncbi:MAG: AraC family transcriptional regulator, partial [Bacteroidota bacterium]
AAAQGADQKALTALTGHDMETLQAESTKVTTAAYNQVAEAAVSATGDPCYGLHAGQYLNLSTAGLVLQIIQTSRTVGEALQYACDFNNLGCSMLRMALEHQDDFAHLTLRPGQVWLEQSPIAVQHTMEGALAFCMRVFRTLTRKRQPVARIHHRFPRPHSEDIYQNVLQTPITWNADTTALVFPIAELEQPVITSDFALLQVLVRHAQEKLALLDAEVGFATRVKRTVLHMVQPEFPSVEQVAENMNLSVRSLQRKLRNEGHSFREVIEQLKYQFAVSHLRKPELSIGEIAYLLNYAEPSSFVRSFKRWTGETPQRFREQAAN